MKLNKEQKALSIVAVVLLIADIVLSFLLYEEINRPPVVQYIEKEVEPVEPPELAEIQLARLNYYKCQCEYYRLLAIDYADNLRERGLLDE